MTLNEAKEILLQAQETMKYGSHNDMMCHSHNLVNALEFMLGKYDESYQRKIAKIEELSEKLHPKFYGHDSGHDSAEYILDNLLLDIKPKEQGE